MRLSYKYRLYPNAAQNDGLTGMLGAFCDLYNAGLQQRIEAYQRQGVSLRYGNQAAELRAVREADERLSGYSFSAEQQVLRRLRQGIYGVLWPDQARGQARLSTLPSHVPL